MLYEISRKLISINKYEDIVVSWNNSVLTVRGNKQLHLLEFSHNLNSLEKGIDFNELTVSSSKNSPLSDGYLTKYVSRGVQNSELVEMVMNSAFWPHNGLLMQEMMNIIAFQWSPFYLINANDNLLAVINSVGNVEFFGSFKRGWLIVMDFSSQMKILIESLKNLSQCPKNFSEVKEAVYCLETASICWAPDLNEDGTCYFVTAQKSGDILFWSIKYHDCYVQPEFCGSIKNSNDVEIVHMLWIPITSIKFLLVTSNEYGEIIAHQCQIKDKTITLLQAHNWWSYKDKMVTTYIEYQMVDEKMLIFFKKHRHLVIQLYDNNIKLLAQIVKNVNDHKITSLLKHKKLVYLTTINTKIYRVDYSIVNNTIEVSLNIIEIKDPCSNHELFGLAISTNGAIYALALLNRKLLHRKQCLNIEIVLLSSDAGSDKDFSNIINNPSKKLTNLWDVIEVIRCKTIKLKKLPEFDYDTLLKDECDIYNLKVYLIILKFYYNLEQKMARGLRGTLSETSVNVIKEKIFMLQAYTQIHTLYEKILNNICLDSFEAETFQGCKKYLFYYCKKYNKNVTDFVTEDILNASNENFKYLCQCCDETIMDFTCKSGHINMICSFSFTPIENDYLICKSCDATVRPEWNEQHPTCVFCDLHLRFSHLIT